MKKLLKRLCSAMVAAVMVMTMAPAAFAADGGAQFQNCLLYTSYPCLSPLLRVG